MTTVEIPLRPLTHARFAEFGDVIEADPRSLHVINNGNTQRFHDLARIDVNAENGHPLLNIFRARPLPQPLKIRILERHPLGSQAFIPLSQKPFMVVVASAGEAIPPNRIQAFLSHGGQGVNYHRNTWHHPIIALDTETDFIVIDRGGPGKNCEEFTFPTSINISIAPTTTDGSAH
ncbi:MAG: ureidoglycolate lyase [Gammaproteobacteria bacterium]|nr:ureidoglycolate lyase [Gammaproteobacteria bacterium]